MTNEVKVDRATASKINPLISSLWTEDTIDSLSDVIYELGYIAVSEHDLATANLFHLFGAIAAALEWEAENSYSIVQARKDRGHD
jgi:hypothetical protein